MFSRDVVGTDRFLDMPFSAQALYFHLGMVADDDGFVTSPRTVARSIGARNEDLATLLGKGYIVVFDSGVIVITDWGSNNMIRSDRYTPTVHTAEKELYKQSLLPAGIPVVNQTDTNGIPSDDHLSPPGLGIGIGIGTGEIKEREIRAPAKRAGGAARAKKFTPPTVEDVSAYCKERGYTFSPEAFVGYYESNGWKVGKNPMKSWKGACASWQSREGSPAQPVGAGAPTFERDGYRINERGEVEYAHANGERDANGTTHVHFD